MENDITNSIKEARLLAGYTQKQVEEELNLRKLTIRDYESGRLKLPCTTAIELSKLYQVGLSELLGEAKSLQMPSHPILLNFCSIFGGHGFEVMFSDPVLMAYLETHRDQFFKMSLFDLLTESLTPRKKKDLALDIAKSLYTLAATDDSVSNSELRCIRYLMEFFQLEDSMKKVTVYASTPYYPGDNEAYLKTPALKHFLVWLMFFFAKADGEVSYQEIEYIEKFAQHIKVNHSNYLFIKKSVVQEEI